MRSRIDPEIPSSREIDVVPTTHSRARQPKEEPGLRGPAKRQIAAIEMFPTPAQRVASVDALRGFSMFAILGTDVLAKALEQMLANAGWFLAALGAVIGTQFTHAEWHGANFYDLVFPLFIFVTGVAIVFSLPKLVEQEGKWAAHKRVLRRSVVLFALGVICYGGVSNGWSEIRLGGVLQRIALCYLFASLLFLNLSLRGMVASFAALLIGYWALMTFVPVPGIGAGSFAQGANLANWIDEHYLPGRKWEGTWDSEGMLSTLPAIGTCLLGVFAGLLLKNPKLEAGQKSRWLICAGLALIAAGLLWSLQVPINKYLWTSSFVLVAGGVAAIMLGAFHEIIDVRGYKAWASAFMWVGASAIVLYVFNVMFGFHVIAHRLVGGDLVRLADRLVTPGAGRFLVTLVALLIALAAARFLYRRKIFLRV
jgi:predicted acyltransferase